MAENAVLKAIELQYRELFQRDDTQPLLAAIAAAASVRIASRPVWLMLVGPPSVGKTSIIRALEGVPGAVVVNEITPRAFLSGWLTKKGDVGDGVLRRLGERGLLLMPDFGDVLDMPSQYRTEVLKIMKNVFDGSYVKWVGVHGGAKVEWHGRAGAVAAVTDRIHAMHDSLSAMGPRFVYVDVVEGGRSELSPEVSDEDMGELRDLVKKVVVGAEAKMVRTEMVKWIAEVAEWAVRVRSALIRDRMGDVVVVNEPECRHRLAGSLEAMAKGALACGLGEGRVAELVERVALDSVPKHKLRLLEVLGEEELDTSEVAERAKPLGYQTVRHGLQDMAQYGVIQKRKEGNRLLWSVRWRPRAWRGEG